MIGTPSQARGFYQIGIGRQMLRADRNVARSCTCSGCMCWYIVPAMKLSRLIQPRSPLFWLMLVFNVLSSVFAWVLRSYPLNTVGLVLVTGLALANAVIGMWLAWRLLRGDGGT